MVLELIILIVIGVCVGLRYSASHEA
jgi:hypothetical protein